MAAHAQIRHLEAALQIIANIFERRGLVYAVMGGMNFYLRGSPRTTRDVDLTVDGRWQLDNVLYLLNNDSRYAPLLLAGTPFSVTVIANTKPGARAGGR